MQQKIILDTNVYIDIFNSGLHENLRNPFQYIVFLAHPVLHELWMGARGRKEVKHLTAFKNEFVRLKRLIIPTVSTLTQTGRICHRLRISGNLDPVYPKHYNDISVAVLARQIGAKVITRNFENFEIIQNLLDFDFETP